MKNKSTPTKVFKRSKGLWITFKKMNLREMQKGNFAKTVHFTTSTVPLNAPKYKAVTSMYTTLKSPQCAPFPPRPESWFDLKKESRLEIESTSRTRYHNSPPGRQEKKKKCTHHHHGNGTTVWKKFSNTKKKKKHTMKDYISMNCCNINKYSHNYTAINKSQCEKKTRWKEKKTNYISWEYKKNFLFFLPLPTTH